MKKFWWMSGVKAYLKYNVSPAQTHTHIHELFQNYFAHFSSSQQQRNTRNPARPQHDVKCDTRFHTRTNTYNASQRITPSHKCVVENGSCARCCCLFRFKMANLKRCASCETQRIYRKVYTPFTAYTFTNVYIYTDRVNYPYGLDSCKHVNGNCAWIIVCNQVVLHEHV